MSLCAPHETERKTACLAVDVEKAGVYGTAERTHVVITRRTGQPGIDRQVEAPGRGWASGVEAGEAVTVSAAASFPAGAAGVAIETARRIDDKAPERRKPDFI